MGTHKLENIAKKAKLVAKSLETKLSTLFEKRFWFLVVGFTLMFAIISLSIGMSQSVWFDEAYSITLAKRSVTELVHLTSIDVHPPVYYLILHFWGGLFGFSELSLRLSSVIPMFFAIILMASLLKRLFNKPFAGFATFLLCLSPMLIRYGFEIRMYAMATMLAVLATIVLVIIEEEKNAKRRHLLQFAYAALVALGMLTLYYTIVIWLTHFAYLLWRTIKNKQPILRQEFWLMYIIAVLLFTPWLFVAIKQFTNGALAQISEPMTVNNLLGVFSFNLLYKPIWQLDQVFGLLLLGFITLFGILLAKTLKTKQKNARFLIFMAAGPLLVEILICLIKPMYVERYLVYSAPFLIALIAYSIFEARNKLRRFSTIYLFLLVGFGIFNLTQVGNFNFQRMQKPDIREMATRISVADKKEETKDGRAKDEWDKGDRAKDERDKDDRAKTAELPILTDSPYEAIELGYYLPNAKIYFYAPYEKLGGGYAPLDKSEFKIFSGQDLKKFKCVRYVYYDAKITTVLEDAGLSNTKNQDTGHALKYSDFCRK